LNETIDHLTSFCSFIAQSAYKHRQDKVVKFLHWKLTAKYHFGVTVVGGSINLTQSWRMLYIKFCGILQSHNCPDIVVVDKQTNKGYTLMTSLYLVMPVSR